MFIVHVSCSDESCAEEIEAVVERIEDADDVVCECGHGTVLVSVAELDTGAQVIELRVAGERRLAA
jgi:hypothetical protein